MSTPAETPPPARRAPRRRPALGPLDDEARAARAPHPPSVELLHDAPHRDPEPRAPRPIAALALQAALNALAARVEAHERERAELRAALSAAREALAGALALIDEALERP